MPAVGFHFSVSIDNDNTQDATFKEVSGINQEMSIGTIEEGGESRFVHRVPGRTKYPDLVLKRGLIVGTSPLAEWCKSTIESGLAQRIEPKLLQVQLLDADNNPLVKWSFTNAYPTKWEVNTFDATKSEIVIETITFAYNYFTVEQQS